MAGSRFLLVKSVQNCDHYRGVREALQRLGAEVIDEDDSWDRLILHSDVIRRSDVALFADYLGVHANAVLRKAQITGTRTALIMDGVLEPANTFINHKAGPGFLRPAPVDLVCASGALDRAALLALGNERVIATGLPRIDRMRGLCKTAPKEPTLLVATARTSAFNELDSMRIAGLLARIRDAALSMGIAVRWRVSSELCEQLGVRRDRSPLDESLERSAAVLSTPSTLVTESILAGRPTALLQPHPRALWQTAPWVWRDRGTAVHAIDRDLDRVAGHVTEACRDSIAGFLGDYSAEFEGDLAELIEDLLSPPAHRMESLPAMTRLLATETPARNIAEILCAFAKDPGVSTPKRIPGIVSIPTPPKKSDRATVVSCVVCEESTIRGVQNWSARLGRAFHERVDLGYDFHTLFVATKPYSKVVPRTPYDPDDQQQHLLIFDPIADIHESMDLLTETIAGFHPDIVLPNCADIFYVAATRLRYSGARTIAIAHSDDDYYRGMVEFYDRWDAAIAVSDIGLRWLAPLAGMRPVARITYGVPVPTADRTPSPTDQPIRLAYIGRIVEYQRRVGLLVVLSEALRDRGVRFRLDLAGDGSAYDHLQAQFRECGFSPDQICFHGAIPFGEERALLASTDLSVLVSDSEGACTRMLEAMATGVVPCVTDVDSGVRDWIVPNENGLVAPVDDIDAMADRIAEIATDRPRLASMSTAARETVLSELTIDRMAERFADVFHTAMDADPTRDPPTDRVANVRDSWRSSKLAPVDPAAADASCFEALQSSGYRAIAYDAPEMDSDAVVIRASSTRPSDSQVERWRESGLGVGISTTMFWDPEIERARGRLERLLRDENDRVVLYGCGVDTRTLLGLIDDTSTIVGFIDDNAAPGSTCIDRPVVPLDRVPDELQPTVIAIASSRYQQVMRDRVHRCPALSAVRCCSLFHETGECVTG